MMIEVDEKHLIEIARLAKTVARQVRLNLHRKTRRFYASSKLLVEYTQQLVRAKSSDAWRSHGTDDEVVMLKELLREAAATMAVAHDLAQERGFEIKSGVVTKKLAKKPRKQKRMRFALLPLRNVQ